MNRIDIKVGYECNNNCLFCVQAHNRGVQASRTFDEIIEILEKSREHYEGVVFTGGEITIRPDALDLVRAAKALNYEHIHIQSNGKVFFYPDFCKSMIRAGATEFGLALHGHTPELHDGLTRAKGSFNATVVGIRNLVSLGMRVLTNTVVTTPNYRYLPEIAVLLTDSGVSQYQFAFVHIMGNALKYAAEVVPRKSLVAPYVHRGLDVGISAGIRVMTEGMPHCFMKGYEEYVVEAFIPETKIYDAGFVIESFKELRLREGKLKGHPCVNCSRNQICEGPWREYPEMFGWDEFEPFE